MSLTDFIPGYENLCDDCKTPIKGPIRRLTVNKKERKLCRQCFRKRLGTKEEDDETKQDKTISNVETVM